MWILNFLPNWIVYAVLFLSVTGIVAAFTLSTIPFISKYSLSLKISSGFVFIVSLWLTGGLANQAAWEARVKEMELKVAKAEAESAAANTKLVSKVVKKIDQIKGTTNENVRVIREVVSKNDSKCELSNSFIVLHNSASQNVVSPSPRDLATGSSSVKASELLQTVTENYSTYYELREVVKGWQEWYKEQKKIYEEVK